MKNVNKDVNKNVNENVNYIKAFIKICLFPPFLKNYISQTSKYRRFFI